MATTGIWKIEKRLDRVIDYTTNPEKTTLLESYQELHNFDEYIDSDFSDEKKVYVTGINCTPEIAYEEMTITKQQFNKQGGILGFHAFQSFAEGEVTPEQCHEIGVKLAQELWGDRFEVIVSTHFNTNHYHNHFVINSVSFKDGKRYYDKRSTYAEMRAISDSLCREYGLSVIKEKPCRYSKINYSNYFQGETERENYYTLAKTDLDRAIGMAYSYSDFEKLMKAMDYELIYRANKLSIRRKPYKKNIRVERYFGDNYSIANITNRIEKEHITRIPFLEEYGIKINYHSKNETIKQKNKGIFALYLYYCYLFKVFPQKKPYNKLPASIRVDVNKMDEISEEIKLLVRNKLETNEQFFYYKKSKENDLDVLKDKRDKLWYRHKKSKSPTEKENILNNIKKLNEEIEPIRKEVIICEKIEERVPIIKEKINEFEKEEMIKNEYIK